MILAESLSLTPGSALSCVAVAVLMSTRSVFGITAVLRGIASGAFGDEGTAGGVAVGEAAFGVVDAGCASTGAAMVRASPIGKRESLRRAFHGRAHPLQAG